MTAFYPPSFDPPVPTVVETDTPCRKCQYNLRGLSSEGRCPECGSAVGLSLRGDLIRYSDPVWVDTLRQGITLILWAVVAFIFAAVVTAITKNANQKSVAGALVSVAAYAMYLGGAWLLTTPDPSGLGEDRYGTSRKIIRLTMLIGVLQQLGNFIAQTAILEPAMYHALTMASSVLALFGTVGTFATLLYLGKLAARIPDNKLTDRARHLMWGIGIPLCIIVVLATLLVAAAGGGRPAPGAIGLLAAFGCVMIICGITLIVYGIMYLLFLEKLGKQLKMQSQLARQSWAGTA
jgi:hypothetical protein